jgi:hypothetical protein
MEGRARSHVVGGDEVKQAMQASFPKISSRSRRQFLWRFGGGLGGVALAQLLGEQGLLASEGGLPGVTTSRGVLREGPHLRPRARRVIQLFMNGGASQMELFDYKPALFQRHGEKFDPGGGQRVEAPTSEPGKLMKPVFPFRQHGECGRWVSDVMPHIATRVDDLAFFMAMQSKTNVHGPGSYLMNTGFLLPGFPCLGAWVSYALGTLTDNLPAFVVLPDTRGLPYNQKGNFSAGFLPVQHQGTVINTGSPAPIADLRPPESAKFITPDGDREGLALVQKFNRAHLEANDADARLDARIQAYELAAKMQLSAPEVFDLAGETEATRQLYGLDAKHTEDFGRRCLLARRLIERGVRFVQVWSGAGGPTNNWDNHSSISKELPTIAATVDRPIAGLLRDLKSRGLLEDTLVLWNTEFGRMPFTQGADGRDHNGGTFVGWMAGAGVRGGVAHGESDEWSWRTAKSPTTNYDFHATVLHLLGIEHEKLTFRHNGFNRRITDVHGEVVNEVLA